MTTITTVPSGWLEPTREQIEFVSVMRVLGIGCPCGLYTWGLINNYPHTSAECDCRCHENEGGD